MKRLLLLIPSLLLVLTASAQLCGDGFYRVQNVGTQRYAYLCDRTGSINMTTQNADIEAVQLWKNLDRAITDPASVIYIHHIDGSYYDLEAQGTGLYEIISHYVQVAESATNKYWVFASQGNISKYLCDKTSNTSREQGSPGFDYKGDLRLWSVFKINDTNNYIGITPTYKVGNKYYQPYYVSFAFKKLNANMKVYYIKKVDNQYGIAVIEEITGDVVPANTPVIIESTSNNAADNKIMPQVSGSSAVSSNQLGGVYFCNPDRLSPYVGTPFDATTMRTLCVRTDGTLGFNDNPTNLTAVELNDYKDHMCLPANSSYLKVTAATPKELKIMTQSEYEAYLEMAGIDGITDNTEVAQYYNISGQKLTSPKSGLNIVVKNGKAKKVMK